MLYTHACNVGPQMQGQRFLFSKGSDVLVGGTQAFEDKLRQASTWYVGVPPLQL
jgi:hypothetical protein